jgi:hypothetical protein
MFDFVTKNFVVISAAVLLIGSTLTMLFLIVYLAVFDWGLIWLIEYSDLSKFFLLAAALVSISAVFFTQFLPHVDIWLRKDVRFRALFIAISLLIMFGGQVSVIIEVARRLGQSDELNFRMLLLCSTAALLFLIWRSVKHFPVWRKRHIRTITMDIAISAVCLGIFALTLAFYVRYDTNVRNITAKNGTFHDAKIILLLSHHTAFLAGRRIYVIPTGDIIEMSSPVNWKDG